MAFKSLSLTLGGFFVCTLMIASSYWVSSDSATYRDLKQTYTVISQNGFHCRSDRYDGENASGFMISRKPLAWEYVNEVPKVGPMGSEWQGKVWVTSHMNLQCPHVTIPDKAKLHIWGTMFAFGDEDIINELELEIDMNANQF